MQGQRKQSRRGSAGIIKSAKKNRRAGECKNIHVESLEQAQSLNFISSPTTRINGRDAAIEVKENYCSSCGTLSGNETYCRIWNFQGEEYPTVPKSLVVEAILKEIYGAGRDAKETKPEDFAPRSNICARSEL